MSRIPIERCNGLARYARSLRRLPHLLCFAHSLRHLSVAFRRRYPTRRQPDIIAHSVLFVRALAPRRNLRQPGRAIQYRFTISVGGLDAGPLLLQESFISAGLHIISKPAQVTKRDIYVNKHVRVFAFPVADIDGLRYLVPDHPGALVLVLCYERQLFPRALELASRNKRLSGDQSVTCEKPGVLRPSLATRWPISRNLTAAEQRIANPCLIQRHDRPRKRAVHILIRR